MSSTEHATRRRMHPLTGVPITYVAAEPEGEPDTASAREELITVRWVSLEEAGKLMGGMIQEAVMGPRQQDGCFVSGRCERPHM